MNFIQQQDPEVWDAITGEADRQQDGLENQWLRRSGGGGEIDEARP